MTLLVLVILAVMWVAVLVPPWLRSRNDGRPSSSVSSFHRQLSTLERTAPGLGRPSRNNPAPFTSGAQQLQHGYSHAMSAGYGPAAYGRGIGMSVRDARQRRRDVVMVLAAVTLALVALAVVTMSGPVILAALASVVLFGGYVYLLAQIRRSTMARTHRGLGQIPAARTMPPTYDRRREPAYVLQRTGH